ncbi:hypothetical protein VI817_009450 [Penicillium citrinum]|nr:hypothetical protein VI817_009450 [Penicillium citrinum]
MTPTIPSGDRNSRVLSPRPPQPASIRSQSPSQPYRRDPPADIGRDRPSSRSRQTSPSHALASESNTTSRRSSPFHHGDRGGVPPRRSRSRSPAHQSPFHRPSLAPGRSPRRDHPQETGISDHMKGPEDPERLAKKQSFDQMQQPGAPRLSRNIPTQPRNLGLTQTPPLGPSQGLKGPPPHNRGPHNASVLAAPTRPRHGAGSRDGSWMGGPSGPRRGPHPMPSHGAPSGPRASFTPPMPGGPGYRYQGPRHGSSVSGSPMTPKSPNYLAGLNSIIPGGRALPSAVDATTEKRLSQLEADKEKLLDQMTSIQKSRRAGLRDWDRLDRESSICALKSELAEGHLQRMADESIGEGVLY